jgi:hypothetical protein
MPEGFTVSELVLNQTRSMISEDEKEKEITDPDACKRH